MINRRNFLKNIVLAGSLSAIYKNRASAAVNYAHNNKNLYSIDNPYKNVNWKKVKYVPSTSHIHLINQQGLDKAYELGYRHLPISNYYPSAPYYPPEKMRVNQFRVKQDFGAMVLPEDGEPYLKEGPLNWNEIIMDKETGWFDSLPEERQQELPFREGDYVFNNVPDDVIFSPNAEHHAFTDTSGSIHVNSIGSFFSSGTFDARNNFRTFWGGGNYSYGTGLPWKKAFEKMLGKLKYPDGGGLTINHPTWSKMEQSLIEEMLDFDERVLGIEVLEAGIWSTEIWDKILQTGRRCLGFFVPDWGIQASEIYSGFNVLLVDDLTEHACLKAYRNGAFFGSELGRNLKFTSISLKKDKMIVETDSQAEITFITDNGIEKIAGDTTKTVFKIPVDKNGIPSVKYVRAEAVNNDKERILTQPVRFKKL